MAYPIEEGDLILVTMEGRLVNQQVLTTFPYRVKIGSPSSADGYAWLGQLLTQLKADDELGGKYRLCMSNDVKELRLKAQKIHPQRYAFRESYFATPEGEVAEDVLPPNSAVVITKKGEAAGRLERGNLHCYGIPKGFITDGQLNGTGIAAYSDLVTEILKTQLVGGDLVEIEPIIFHRAVPSASRTAVHATVQDTLRVMRRRTVGQGS